MKCPNCGMSIGIKTGTEHPHQELLGSVSSGDLREAAIYDAYYRGAERLLEYCGEPRERGQGYDDLQRDLKPFYDRLGGLEVQYQELDESDDEESVIWIVEELEELISEVMEVYGIAGIRFGAHEGDGADFGFWITEEEE
jgi:hypothetical protein